MGGTATMRMASRRLTISRFGPQDFRTRIFSLADKLAAQQAGAPLPKRKHES